MKELKLTNRVTHETKNSEGKVTANGYEETYQIGPYTINVLDANYNVQKCGGRPTQNIHNVSVSINYKDEEKGYPNITRDIVGNYIITPKSSQYLIKNFEQWLTRQQEALEIAKTLQEANL